MQHDKTPKAGMLTTFQSIWKEYRSIFLDYEAALAKDFGRPKADSKKIFLAIMYILWTGGSWRALPKSMGKRSTTHAYFRKWALAGLFKILWERIAEDAAAGGFISPEIQIVDGTHIMSVYMPTEIAGFSYKHHGKRGVKISIIIDKHGTPVSIEVDSASKHDAKSMEGALSNSVITEFEPREKTLLGDSGYIGEAQEQTAADYGFTPNFRPKKSQVDNYDAALLRQNKKNRWTVERSISWVKNMRRIRTCYEKSIETFRGFCELCCASLIFRRYFM